MKKNNFLLLSFCLLFSTASAAVGDTYVTGSYTNENGAFVPSTTYTITDFISITGTGSKTFSATDDGKVFEITGGSADALLQYTLSVATDVNITFILNDAHIQGGFAAASAGSTLTILADAKVTLILPDGINNTINCRAPSVQMNQIVYYNSAIRIRDRATLTVVSGAKMAVGQGIEEVEVEGTGYLLATSNPSGTTAGVISVMAKDATLIVNGSHLEARTMDGNTYGRGAAIGGGDRRGMDGGTVYINGGKLTLHSGEGSGIGSGFTPSNDNMPNTGGNIHIFGGEVITSGAPPESTDIGGHGLGTGMESTMGTGWDIQITGGRHRLVNNRGGLGGVASGTSNNNFVSGQVITSGNVFAAERDPGVHTFGNITVSRTYQNLQPTNGQTSTTGVLENVYCIALRVYGLDAVREGASPNPKTGAPYTSPHDGENAFSLPGIEITVVVQGTENEYTYTVLTDEGGIAYIWLPVGEDYEIKTEHPVHGKGKIIHSKDTDNNQKRHIVLGHTLIYDPNWPGGVAGTGNVPTDIPPTDVVSGAMRHKHETEVEVSFDHTLQKANCIFLGWATDPAAKTPDYKVDGSTSLIITQDRVLYAVWQSDSVTPTFSVSPLTYCADATIPALPVTSDNGVTGTWSPALDNTTTTTYTFTPAAGECARTAQLTITITPRAVAADITTKDVTICEGVTATLTASASGVTNPTYYWYDSQTSTVALANTASYTTGTLTATTSYFVSVEGDDFCENTTGTRKEITVTVEFCKLLECASLSDKYAEEDYYMALRYTHDNNADDWTPALAFTGQLDSLEYIVNGDIRRRGFGVTLHGIEFPIGVSQVAVVGHYGLFTDTCRFNVTVTVTRVCPASIDDHEGNTYNVTSLSGLCWTANLKSVTYANGDAIPFAKPYYHVLYPDSAQHSTDFGLLYTYESATGGEICPVGWRLPTSAEWALLDLYDTKDLQNPLFWLSPNDNTNALGFDARGAGFYNSATQRFENLYGFTAWWSFDAPAGAGATTTNTIFTYYCEQTKEQQIKHTDAISVRCVYD